MLILHFLRLCLAACFLACAAAGFSALPASAQPPKAAHPKVTAQETFAFSKAVHEQDVAGVAKALKAHPSLANAPLVFSSSGIGSGTLPPLSLAVVEVNVPIVRLLVQSGANVNAEDGSSGQTPMQDAVQLTNLQVVTLLLAHGAHINRKASDGTTCLYEAIGADDPAMVALLLAHGAEVNVKDNKGETPLALARRLAETNSAAMMTLLRRHGAKE